MNWNSVEDLVEKLKLGVPSDDIEGVKKAIKDRLHKIHMSHNDDSESKKEVIELTNALNYVKACAEVEDIKNIGMPRIGCGIDGLDWNYVKKLIKLVFEDTDVDIIATYL